LQAKQGTRRLHTLAPSTGRMFLGQHVSKGGPSSNIPARSLHDPAAQAYIARRVAEGKTRRDALRLLKRYLARHLYRVLNNQAPLMT
jgi:hypothetical protein